MNRWKSVILTSCLIVPLVAQVAISQTDKSKKLDDFIAPFANANEFSGVVLAAEDGKVIYEKAFGLANADFKIKNQLNTRIGIASVTKHMTLVIRAMVILVLVTLGHTPWKRARWRPRRARLR